MRGYTAIGLYKPKDHHNVGSVLRAAMCFDASLVIVQGARYKRASTDTTKAYRHIPLLHGDVLDLNPFDCVPVAIEINKNAVDIRKFTHPERAYYIFGPEDGSVSNEIISRVRHTVSIPTKFCMNLAATVNVVLFDRLAKRSD